MKNKAIKALIKMGMPANIKGFQYIADAMELFEADEIWSTKPTMLYYKLSKMYNTTQGGVERAIRYAFSVVLERGNLEMVESYLTLSRPTNGNLLNTFFLTLSQEGRHMEDKNKICRSLLPILQETRALSNLSGLKYIPEKECVVASFPDRPSRTVCVACDSGIGMIRDIVEQLN